MAHGCVLHPGGGGGGGAEAAAAEAHRSGFLLACQCDRCAHLEALVDPEQRQANKELQARNEQHARSAGDSKGHPVAPPRRCKLRHCCRSNPPRLAHTPAQASCRPARPAALDDRPAPATHCKHCS